MHPALFALKRAYQSARHALEVDLQDEGLSVAQLDILKLLLAEPTGLDQRALQSAVGITSATLTRLLAGMEQRGLVSRGPHPTDARGKTVRVSAKGRRRFERLMASGEGAYNARLLRGFSKAETLALTSMLARIADNMAADPNDG